MSARVKNYDGQTVPKTNENLHLVPSFSLYEC